MRTPKAVAALALVLTLVACGTGPDVRGEQGVVVHAANGDVRIPAPPSRIVSLSPTHTETLFAIGAGTQVMAVDDRSDVPAQAPRTDVSAFDPSAETVIGMAPDLVVVSDDRNSIVEALGRAGIPVLEEPAAKDLDGVYDQIEDMGRATGHTGGAERLVTDMRARIDRAVQGRKGQGLTYFHELGPELYTATSATFIGRAYQRFGLANVADGAARPGGDYLQFDTENLLHADPDLIFLADTRCCRQSPGTVAKRPGFGNLKAVARGDVVPLDDDVASRWGPRVAELYEAIARAVAAARR
ncbi:ABC transporter substrate-binding protein [Tsukamurella sp. 8F]|uniref:ABC transporter substrate-binding protein n=1 Tax=unclassified Tsukamurella TaxID=2633480 RepID=UPI0023B90A21|nr:MULTISPECIES: ABC transporter substrate-binding protein [unclassified Tsukamurella]MDF0528770.1 ABC transporter substrate-binding protein [Tsukamurella sp. 8J]MDF0586605.1 ABC transporter substrate-binding protein [Tsukamurella sp. 8F]